MESPEKRCCQGKAIIQGETEMLSPRDHTLVVLCTVSIKPRMGLFLIVVAEAEAADQKGPCEEVV